MRGSKDINDRYNAVIAQADQLYENKSYKEAKIQYQSALNIVAGDAYALDMISRLDPLIAQQDAEEAARIAAEEEAARLAAEAEAARLAAEAEAARIAAEEEAARLAAEEAARIAAEEEAARLAAEAAAAAEAERQARIQNTLDAASSLLAEGKYVEAKSKYQEVFSFDEGNAIATAKINEIDGILAQIAADEEAARLERERIESLRPQYNAFIKEGDKQFASKTFDKAVEAYAKAEELNIGESYPTEMIARINKIIEDNKLYELNTEAFTMAANTPRRFTFNPVDVASRRSNYIILKARNLTPGKSFPMIVSFGSDSGKNGGFVLAISENEEEKTYIFRIGGQYKWFSENNTWIELISENDDVEVSLVMISRSN